ncbi:MAG TPA: pyridoxal-phosphate dependent enzyme [Bacteroides sp.]|nr:pyridoxal-phosphate dependent enzyme [Bacteroides sp.]
MSRRVFLATGGIVLGVLAAGSGGVGYMLHKLNRIGRRSNDFPTTEDMLSRSALFRSYPDLARHIPWISLGDIPTPVEELGSAVGMTKGKLWVKRDDLTSPVYGGNKVRKLEYLLADAALRGRKSLITIGGLGSNHALATAVHGYQKGFEVHLCLFDQPFSKYVRRNLAGFLAAGAKIHYCYNLKEAYKYARKLFKDLQKQDKSPYFILSGGTCGLSNVGHVNAAMEVARQVKDGLLPAPEKLFVAAGTCGTISGLIAGLKIAGMSTRVVGVKVVDSFPAYPYIIRYYAQKVADYLRKSDRNIPKVKIEKSDFELLTEYLGGGYGVITDEGKSAVNRVSEKISLETTYTGKTLAACLDYCEKTSAEEKILFWNSYNSAEFEQSLNYDGLPEEIIQKLSL